MATMLVSGRTPEGQAVLVFNDWMANAPSASKRPSRRKGKQVYRRIAKAKEKRAWRDEVHAS